jgi:CHAT domain-containing protein/Flp pilus assembly protein TadD
MPASRLPPGAVEVLYASGPAHRLFRLDVQQGQFLHVEADQRGSDVELVLHDSSGASLLAVDSPNSEWGSENLFFVAEHTGSYRLDVSRLSAARDGRCLVRIAEIRSAALRDTTRAAACQALAAGDSATTAGTPQSRRQGLHLYDQALLGWRSVGDLYEEAITETKIGSAWSRLGEIRPAVDHWQRALALLRQRGPEPAFPALLNNLGTGYLRLGDVAAARSAYETALATSRSLGDRREESAALTNLANLEQSAGMPWAALATLDEALTGWRALGERSREAAALEDQGRIYTVLGKLVRARSILEQADAIFHSAGDRHRQAEIALTLGWVHFLQGDAKTARAELLRSLALQREEGDRRGEGVALDRLGSFHREIGDFNQAATEYQQALALFRDIGDRQAEATTLSNLGQALTLKGDPAAGMRCEQAALDLLGPLSEPSAEAYTRFRLGQAERALGQLEVARRDVEESLAGLESIRDKAKSDELRMSYVDSVHDHYEFLVDLLMELDSKKSGSNFARAAVSIAERSHARSLLDLVAGARAVTASPHILDADEIVRLLGSDTVLLLYSLGEARSFVWALSAAGVESAILPPRELLESAARRYHRLAERSASRGAASQERLTAREITRALISPVAGALKGRRIVVVADGVLAYLPFAALPDPADDAAPLLAHHEVVVLPSASVLAAVRQRAAARPTAPRLLAILADPLLPPANAAPAPGSMRGGSAPGTTILEPLPQSRREAEAILALAPPDQGIAAVGANASTAWALGGGLAPFRIVHFATHAIIDPTTPELSGIVLSSTDARGRPKLGFLRPHEIAKLGLSADLVVLGACRTGLGQELRGEGLLGLTQSFFQAGATRLVVTLWNVDDRATALLMERFYAELLRNRRSPAAALRLAQLSLRDDPRWAAPYYWAGFELQGDWQPLR